MMKRKQKRYESENEILAEIENYRAEAQSLFTQSTEAENQIHDWAIEIQDKNEKIDRIGSGPQADATQWEINEIRLRIESKRAEIIKWNVRRHNIENSHLPRMKQALAAFNTILLPITKDAGVVL